MSERERWIVYPLLFLALGAALRDKLIKQTTSDKVICEELWCERVNCGTLLTQQGQRMTPVLSGGTLSVPNIEAGRMRQSGQQVLSLGPQLLQLLKAMGIWGEPSGQSPPVPVPVAPDKPAEPAPTA